MELLQIIKVISEKRDRLNEATSFNKYAKIFELTDLAVLADFCIGKERSVFVIEKREGIFLNDTEIEGFDSIEEIAKLLKEHFDWEGIGIVFGKCKIQKLSAKKIEVIVIF